MTLPSLTGKIYRYWMTFLRNDWTFGKGRVLCNFYSGFLQRKDQLVTTF